MDDSLALVALSTKCLAFGILVRSLEVIANWREWPEDRLLGWKRPGATRTGRLARVERALSSPPLTFCIMTARIGAAAACLGWPFTGPAVPWLLAALAATQAYYNRRFRLILQAADSMFLIGLAAVFTASLDVTDRHLREIALAFLALQAQFAYLSTGLNKLGSPMWREGRRLVATVSAGPFRLRTGELVVGVLPAIAVAASWSVILIELLLSVSVFLPAPAFYAALALGLVFHLSVAVLMGLHGFLWSFGATYPALYFVHRWIR